MYGDAFIKLDFTKDKLNYIYGTDVKIETEDKSVSLTFSDEQFQKLNDDYREYIGEKTVSELEDEVLKLENIIDDLKEKLEIQEQHYEAKMEKLNEGYPF